MNADQSKTFYVKLEKEKVSLESNLKLVDFCSDSCVDKKYTDFKLSETQIDCVKNCFAKVSKVETILNKY